MFLFLRDIQDNKSIKIEGKSEDIEIETEYGLVYAQAKSIYDVNVRSSVYSDYAKHNDKTQFNVLEYIIYQTGNIIRLMLCLNNEANENVLK